jgi:PAS domain S-box-containing protein
MINKYKNINDYVDQRGFYEAVVEDGADIIFIVDFSGVILYHNPSVRESLGHPPKSLIGSKFSDYILPEMVIDFKSQFENCTKEPYVENIEFTFKKYNHSFSHLEFNSINLKHKEGIDGLILDCRDINQRKKDAEELLRAQKAKEQFMANMSHEIRTPINGIAGMLSLLDGTKLSQEQKKYINAIKTSSDNLKVIINDILDISIIESGKLKFEKIGFNIRHQLRSIIETFIHQANEKNIYLEYQVDPNMNMVVLGDPVRLNQILINLISNALKFTDRGGIRVNVNCTHQENDELIISFEVIDTGIGIAEEKLDTIFESFRQADESVTRKYGGTGLGLAISKQLVELQNGNIGVSSNQNIGTTFTFSIPYQKGENKDLIINQEQFKDNKEDFDSLEALNILLVEDNDINRMYAANILGKWNCRFDTAENGYIATEKLKKTNYDLILMDVQMPVMDGIEATTVIRKNFPSPTNQIPIIALTANVLKGDPEKYTAIGMNGYISKPFLPRDLYNVIVEHTNSSHKAPEQPIAAEAGEELIYNLTFLRNMADGDYEFINDLISAFISSVEPAILEMKVQNENLEWQNISKAAHKIKPSIKLMGIPKLHDIAIILEGTCEKEIDKAAITTLINQFEKLGILACKQLRKELVKIK